MKGSFTSLNPNAEIFIRIEKEKPQWWKLLCNDADLYIDIRKVLYFPIHKVISILYQVVIFIKVQIRYR